MKAKPFAVLGDFWQPILDRVREVEQDASSAVPRWGEADGNLLHSATTPQEAAAYLAAQMKRA